MNGKIAGASSKKSGDQWDTPRPMPNSMIKALGRRLLMITAMKMKRIQR